MALTSIDYGLSSRENHLRNLRKTKEMQILSAQNKSLAVKFLNMAERGSMFEKLNSEISAMICTLGTGSDNRTKEARQNATVGMSRAKRAVNVLSYSNKYEPYEFVINSTADKNFDSKGLPQAPVRVFIASQKTVLRNNISSEICSQSDKEVFAARIVCLNAFEKEYKALQTKYMETFIKKNPEHPATAYYLLKNPPKNISIER